MGRCCVPMREMLTSEHRLQDATFQKHWSPREGSSRLVLSGLRASHPSGISRACVGSLPTLPGTPGPPQVAGLNIAEGTGGTGV